MKILALCFALASSPTLISSSHAQNLSTEEVHFHQLINRFRGLLGLSQLSVHTALQKAASGHSEWMAEFETLSHNGPTSSTTPFMRMKEAGYVEATAMGENVACGNGDARKTFLQWAFSPGHLANMLNPRYREMGIARRGSGEERCPYYWTHNLGARTFTKEDSNLPIDPQRIHDAIEAVAGPLEDSVLSEIQ